MLDRLPPLCRVLTLTLLGLLSSCSLGIDWKNHASYRCVGKDLTLAHIDPDEVIQGAVSANLHYLTLALDTVFVRNLPGLTGRSVALGLEIHGILPKGRAIQTVLDLKEGVGEHSFLSFDNVALIEPFLYTGQNLTITLHFRAIPDKAAADLRGRIAGAGDLVKKINPSQFSALEAGVDLFKSTIGAFLEREHSWKYQFTLYPADSVYRDKPELLLTAARHILLLMPPARAPSELRALKPERVMKFLRMRGNRLVWRHNDQEYTETPYIVLNITRYRRYPSPDTELRKVAAEVDKLIEHGSLDAARSLLPHLAIAINNDRIITAQEKNLERSWKDLREARIAMLMAEKAGDRQEELRQIEKQIRSLAHVRTHFSRMLYPFELKDLDYRVSQLALRAENLGRDTGLALDPIRALAASYRQAAERLREPPPRATPTAAASPDLAREPPPPLPTWKRFYERWWFWTLVGAVAAGAGGATYAATRGKGGGPTVPPGTLPVPFLLQLR
jgi:hypothetical protein